MLLFNSDSSRLINKLSFIAKKACLWAKMVKSSKDGSWKQNKRWSRTELSVEGLTFLKVNSEMPMSSSDLTFKCLRHNRKNWILHTEIYKQHKTQDHKTKDL